MGEQLDLAWLVNELERFGLALSAVPLSDGTLSVTRWRSIRYWEHAEEAEALWSAVVGDNRHMRDQLARFLLAAPRDPAALKTLPRGGTPLVPDADPSGITPGD